MTIARYCEEIPSVEWNHDARLKDVDGVTTAMRIARYCK